MFSAIATGVKIVTTKKAISIKSIKKPNTYETNTYTERKDERKTIKRQTENNEETSKDNQQHKTI